MQTVANEQNLIQFNAMTEDRHRELSQRGGKASGEARRKKRERINAEKAAQAAEHELYRDSLDIMRECAKLLKMRQNAHIKKGAKR